MKQLLLAMQTLSMPLVVTRRKKDRQDEQDRANLEKKTLLGAKQPL